MQQQRLEVFKKTVNNTFNVYNSLFLNLPYRNIENVGMLIPLLLDQSKKGLEAGKNPQQILEGFFKDYAGLTTEESQIDFMFRIIQYVERQVVLYDSVEDAAFPKLHKHSSSLSIKDYFQIIDKNKSWDEVAEKLSNFSARIILTAHPTQFYTPAVLDIMTDLRKLIVENNITEIDKSLQQLGLTSLLNSKKPTPLDEAKNIIHILRNVYYDAIGDLFSYIKTNIPQVDFNNYNIVKLGFWPGGDRDGNPFVTTEMTDQVADELRTTLMKCYYKDLKALHQKLSFTALQEPLIGLRKALYDSMFDANALVPYDFLIGELQKIKDLLVSKYFGLYLKDLDALIDKVKIFKTHFATLDIRQDHSIHFNSITAILKHAGIIKESLEELSPEVLTDKLLHLDLEVAPDEFEDALVSDTLKNIRNLKNIQAKNGQDGCNRYIISNSEDKFSVLFVWALFRWSGYKEADIHFDIVPLFETMHGMDTSEQSMQELFQTTAYMQHVKKRGNKHTIMLGFSDGTKDGGYVKANWSILKTKENLTSVCKQYDVSAVFFDGRGGPPARGGGKTHRFYAAQTKEIANNEIQLTIQGQTITSTYGTRDQFVYNCEQLLTAGLSNNIFGKENTISIAHRALMETLSERSFTKYDALKQHPKFMPYLENRSTLKYYTKANIGSRPGKRGQKAKLELSDLRAISFVGSWSQLKQNVPGYFGIGSAIASLEAEGKLGELQEMFKEVPYFKALMQNSMMALAKCYFELTSYMKEDPEYGDFWQILHDEYTLSKEKLLLISGLNILMEKEAVSRESVLIRENIVLPLLVIQQYALQKIGQNAPLKEIYEKIVTRSLYGNINASRNSA
ncbi:MAG: phosphoenolpyruvate carboxylase [Flavobacteriaceae bacterium]|jgi:phosphoenolpyruvate carboxylase|nr:phosphoenolpyruvate carboxylase [Flavobacteriaceae bacterium]MDG2318016.1 phosphoenolpyruvate carboxylase [Flavobacteriaceae bacterium]